VIADRPPVERPPVDRPPVEGTGATTAPAVPSRARSPWRAVAVPIEHGGWGLTLEPVLLGLLLEPSLAGFALAGAALVAFAARTPVKVVLVDRFRNRWLPRTRTAATVAAVELAVLVGLVAIAVVSADHAFWPPLLLAAPLVLVELWFDMRSRGRRLVPEVAGTIGIGAVAAAIVLAGGADATLAGAAWAVIVARAVASLPFVRYQLHRASSRPLPRPAQDAAQGAAVLIALGCWALGWWTWPAVAAVAVLASMQVALARRPAPRAVLVGVQQLVAGVVLVVVAGLTLA
jgi:hypothetical protein